MPGNRFIGPQRPTVMPSALILAARYFGTTTPRSLFGRPLLMILSEQASQEYLNYLKQKHISYITTGRDGIDLASALETLRTVFGVNRLAVVGGGHINGSLLDQGLIDEVSIMYGYGIDGREGMTAAFDGRTMERNPVRLAFKSVEEQDGIVWMRYQVVNS